MATVSVAEFQTYVLGPGAILTNGPGESFIQPLYASGGNTLHIFGLVVGGTFGIRSLGPAPSSPTYVTYAFIGETGYVFGQRNGYSTTFGGDTIINRGTISGDAIGVGSEYSYHGVFKTLDNMGLIVAGAGQAFGINAAVYTEAVNQESTFLDNSGVIKTELDGSYAIRHAGNSTDKVLNTGSISGVVNLGFGNDTYDGRAGAIDGAVFGGANDDKIYTGAGDNILNGDSGSDTLAGGAGADTLNGGSGTDRASYSTASAGVTANLSKPSANKGDAKGDVYSSIEELRGSAFDDKLTGNSSGNALFGGDGDDTLNGGRGKDSLSGGEGADQFIFDSTLNASTNVDTITDFDVTEDRIQIDNAVFVGLSAGTLASSAFKANTSGNASDSSDRIIYETDTGNLYFDADGNGSGAKILFAKLDAGLSLTSSDFVVI